MQVTTYKQPLVEQSTQTEVVQKKDAQTQTAKATETKVVGVSRDYFGIGVLSSILLTGASILSYVIAIAVLGSNPVGWMFAVLILSSVALGFFISTIVAAVDSCKNTAILNKQIATQTLQKNIVQVRALDAKFDQMIKSIDTVIAEEKKIKTLLTLQIATGDKSEETKLQLVEVEKTLSECVSGKDRMVSSKDELKEICDHPEAFSPWDAFAYLMKALAKLELDANSMKKILEKKKPAATSQIEKPVAEKEVKLDTLEAVLKALEEDIDQLLLKQNSTIVSSQ